MRFTTALLGCLALAVAGCGGRVTYHHDWDQDADFGTYATYNWAARSGMDSSDPVQGILGNDLMYRRIQSAVDAQLQAKGLTKADSAPDMLVAVHAGVQDKLNVQDWGYNYGYPYYGWGGRDIQVYHYKEGTLILDLIDAKVQELVWRGSATGTVDDNPSPDRVEARVREVVGRMLENYPPTAP